MPNFWLEILYIKLNKIGNVFYTLARKLINVQYEIFVSFN